MKKVTFLLLPVLILSGCFEQANAEPKERIPFGGGKAQTPGVVLSDGASKARSGSFFPIDGMYAEDGRLLWPKKRIPHDVVSIKSPKGDFEFRVGKPGDNLGEWQPISNLSPELVRGQILQVAIKESDIDKLQAGWFEFETMLDRFFKTKQVRTRKEWGAKDAKNDMTTDAWKRLFAVHHSAGTASSDDATVRQIQLFHMGTRKWSDIGYHFLIGPDGKIFEGRNFGYQGAHVSGHNKESIAINFLGCFDEKECHAPKYPEVAEVSDAMIESLGGLIGALSFHYGIDVDSETVKGHQEFSGAATACPGNRVMKRMDLIRAIANDQKEKLNRIMLGLDKDEM